MLFPEKPVSEQHSETGFVYSLTGGTDVLPVLL